ncbi:MAG: hypothetical protein IJR78_01990 [Clostridia bacterium]|nr:hypothetical protein [Clostridia bacterium]MBR3135499.1 hypothetical protein [Clostridia bacterium]
MRCYRCGTNMDEDSTICPACGFDLNSPVEIRMCKGMMGADIFDQKGTLLWTGRDSETAYIDAPERKNIRICWKADFEIWCNVKNGEAYRFEHRIGAPSGFVQLIKTRAIPKK